MSSQIDDEKRSSDGSNFNSHCAREVLLLKSRDGRKFCKAEVSHFQGGRIVPKRTSDILEKGKYVSGDQFTSPFSR
jgi:hypothetical protein